MEKGKTQNAPPALADPDDTLAQALALQLWTENWDELSEEKEAERTRNRQTIARLYGADEESPLACMYCAFVDGLTKGLELAMKLKGAET